MDSFLDSMTFASGAFSESIGCDCDECGIIGSSSSSDNNNKNSKIPGPILTAMREHKRQKILNQPLKRTQERKLICRSGPTNKNVAVWNWVLPLDAEPLIEYGSTHRIVWVEKLPLGNKLKSIGHGIIGSSDEEKTRIVLNDWIEGGIYFIPSNGGKAIGFIHTTSNNTTADDAQVTTPSKPTEDSENNKEASSKVSSGATTEEEVVKKVASTSSTTIEQQPQQPQQQKQKQEVQQPRGGGHAIMWQVKIPMDVVESSSSIDVNPVTMEGWIFMLIALCQNLLNKKKESNNNNNNKNETTTTVHNDNNDDTNKKKSSSFQYYEFPQDCHAIIRRAIQEAQENSSHGGGGGFGSSNTARMSSSSSMAVHNNNTHQNQPPA